jgi:hypothetical protein
VISNYEYANGKQLDPAMPEFFVSKAQVRKPSSAPTLVVIGWLPAVRKQDRVDIRWAVRGKSDHLAIRKRIAGINEIVAHRSEAAGRISASCFVLSLLPDGHVWAELYGDVKEKFLVRCISGGNDLTPIAEKTFYEQYPLKTPVFRGATVTHQENAYFTAIVLRPE